MKLMRIAAIVLACGLVGGVIAASGIWLWLISALPHSSFLLTRSETGTAIMITRDKAGLPTIEASSEEDAAFALGYVHAQDRLFQMDLMRRYGRGRLSEWFGVVALGGDKFMRTLGFSALVEVQYRRLSAPLRRVLQSYADGVNAFSSHRRALPPEYYMLNVDFVPWRPEDSLIWGKLIDLELTGNFKDELLHAAMLKVLPQADMAVLFPAYPADAPVIVQQIKSGLRELPIEQLYAGLPDRVGALEASNNWVVSGRRSSTGKPLLANDPHLGFSIPSAWYLARLITPSDTLTGATAAGVPFVLIGHNTRISWGITATRSDVADLFVEQVEADDPERYVGPDGPMRFLVRREMIAVKGQAPIELVVRQSRHGPILSDLPGFAKQAPSPRHVLALQATWLSEEDESPEAAWALSHAHNWDEFRDGLRKLTAPQQNFVYADIEGNIGFISPARVPVRKKGKGWLPVPGWSDEYDWGDDVAFERLPATLNPPAGMIASANNKPDDRDDPFLAQDWIPPYRAERIKQLLEGKAVFTADDMATIQFDTVSLSARELLPLLSSIRLENEVPRRLAEQLLRWDGRMDQGLTEPLVYSAWLRELTRALLEPRLGRLFNDYAGFRPEVVHSILKGYPEWCGGRSESRIRSCVELIAHSFERAVEFLVARSGPPPWRWGAWHQAVYDHPLWSKLPILSERLGYRFGIDGSADTINNSFLALRNDSAPFRSYFGSNLRMVVDLSDIEGARFMILPGQSGNALSDHYGDLLDGWQQRRWLQFERR